MALMAAKGEITPMPECAIFADTGDESKEVYNFLDWLIEELPFPVYKTSRSRLSDNLVELGFTQIPSFKAGGLGKRQCTKHWKIMPVQKELRRVTGTVRKKIPNDSFILWLGISTDEVSRCKDSRAAWIRHRWPLIEKMMSRAECLKWMKRNRYPEPPKSACVYCAYRSARQWRESKLKGGHEWELILKVSRQLEEKGDFLTSHCLPIDQVDFSTEEERGQLNMFENECEGMCGV